MRLVTFSVILLFCTQALTALRSPLDDEIKMALNLPIKNRIKIISKKGSSAFFSLKSMVFNEKLSMQHRWRSLTTLAIIFKEQAEPEIKKAARSRDWFLRNASVIAAKYCSPSFAHDLSIQLLKDKALVVRTAAVETLSAINAKASKKSLYNELYSPINFKKRHSLWIRKDIAEALVQFSEPGDESLFINMLEDVDERVMYYGVRGLEKVSGLKQAQEQSLKKQVVAWKSWYWSHAARKR